MAEDLSGTVLDLEEDDDLEVFSKKTSLAVKAPQTPSLTPECHRNHDDQNESLERDLFISVDHPESHVSAIETFIMYRVLTRTSRGDFDSSEVEVLRRFQEFLWLRSKMEEDHPTLIVPPLPEKFVMKGMVERFNEDFIETRKRALHRFLQKISVHPVLARSPHLKAFLTAEDLSPHMRKGPGLLSRVGDTVRFVAQSFRGKRTRDEEFNSIQEYAEQFNISISSMDKVTQRVISEQREYMDELKRCSPTYNQWAELEQDGLSELLRGVSQSLELCERETEQRIQELSQSLLPVLHEYALCADTLKAVLRRRDNIQADFEMKNDALSTRRLDPKTTQVLQLQEKVELLDALLEEANGALRKDWSLWRRTLTSDLRAAFVTSAERTQEHYQKCLSVWESFLLSQNVVPQLHKKDPSP